MQSEIVILILLFSGFAILHSITASNKIKIFIVNRFPTFSPFYRFSYNVLSFMTLWFFYVYSPKPHTVLFDLPYPWDFIILIPKAGAIAGFLYTMNQFDGSEFLGIKQVIQFIKTGKTDADPDATSVFITKGAYRFSRHPLYMFSIIFLICQSFVTLFYFSVVILFILYFYIGTWFEEKRLTLRFGEEYLIYKKRVPRIFPWDFF